MPTIQEQAGDIQWIPQLTSGTSYVGYGAALTAAVTLSAGNSNTAVLIAQVTETDISEAIGTSPLVQLPGNGIPLFVIGLLSSTTTYYPQDAGRKQAYNLSSSNSNAPVYLAKVVNEVTAP